MNLHLGQTPEITEVRKPVSAEILALAESVSNQALVVADRATEKLSQIMREEPENSGMEPANLPVYPPFFDKLRVNLERIQAALNSINSSLNKVEF